MNSGMRLTAAVIALVVISTGIYYASLGEDDERQSPVTLADTDVDTGGTSSPAIDTPPDPTPTVTQEPAIKLVEPATVTEPATTTEAVDPSDASSREDIGGSTEAVGQDAVTDSENTSSSPSESAEDDPGLEEETAEADTDAGLSSPDESASADSIEEASDQTPETEPSEPEVEDPNLDAGSDDASDSMTPLVAPGGNEPAAEKPRRPGRTTDAPGLGAHVLVSSDALADVLNPAARAFRQADPSLVIIPVDNSHAWLAVPKKLQRSPFLESGVVANHDDTGMQFVLVREDLDGSISLEGRIAEAEAASFPGTDRFRVRYRVNQDQIDSVRRDSSVLIGNPVAWVVNGGVVAISRPRIAISQRSMLPISTDEKTAYRMAMSIVGTKESLVEMSSNDDSSEAKEATETPASETPTRAAVAGRPARAGELPEEAYTIYTIKPSDNPSSIAKWWFGDANKYSLILQANPLVDPNKMKVGDEIRLPPKDFEMTTIIDVGDGKQPVVHIVQSGENLSAIALAAYGNAALWPRIYEANKDKIKNPSNLSAGMELIIP